MANLIAQYMPRLQAALLGNFGDEATYDSGFGEPIALTVKVTQPRMDDGSIARWLKLKFRAADLAGQAVERGHLITVGEVRYRIHSSEQTRFGWVTATCEVER
jgi:hypothetical protein